MNRLIPNNGAPLTKLVEAFMNVNYTAKRTVQINNARKKLNKHFVRHLM